MKESLRNIRQIISRITWLRSILVVLGMMMMEMNVWGVDWIGEPVSTTKSFYLYNVSNHLFLNPTGTYGVTTPQYLWSFSSITHGTISTNVGNTTWYIYVEKTAPGTSGNASIRTTIANPDIVSSSTTIGAYKFQHSKTSGLGQGTKYFNLETNSKITAANTQGEQNDWLLVSETQYKSTLPYYFRAIAANRTGDTGGSAYVTYDASLQNSTTSTSVETNCTDPSAPSTTITQYSTTAYYRAVPAANKVFIGWSTTADGNNIIPGAGANYAYTITSDSHNSGSPTETTLYAVFGDKYVPVITIANGDNSSMLVGETISFSFDNTDGLTFDISNTSLSSDITNGQDVITYNYETNTLMACNAGVATITFHQPNTETIQGKDISFDILVSKRANPITINGETSFVEYLTYADQTSDLTITSANNSREGRPDCVVTQRSGEDVATYTDPGSRKYITTTFNEGTATWSVTQPEDYMYDAGASTITVNVNPAQENCYILQSTSEFNAPKNSGTSAESRFVWKGRADKITFSAKTTGDNSTNLHMVTLNANGEDLNDYEYSLGTSYWVLEPSLNNNVRGVRFYQRGQTSTRKIKDIYVHRSPYIEVTPSSLTMDNTIKGHTSIKYLVLEYNNCDSGTIYLSSSDPTHFTVSPSSIAVSDNSTGSDTITVTYHANATAEDNPIPDNAVITVYNKARKTTVNVCATTIDKYNLLYTGTNLSAAVLDEFASGISFNYENNESVAVPAPVDGDVEGFDSSIEANHFYYTISHEVSSIIVGCNPAHAEHVVTYDPSTNKFKAWNAGTATITFYEKGTSIINSRDDVSYIITVTKHTPEFTWNNGNEDVNTGIYFNHNSVHSNPYTDIFASSSTTNNSGCSLTLTSSDEVVATIEQGSNQWNASLSTYNYYTYEPSYSAHSADITITQAENYYWAAHEEIYTITPSVAPYHVEFTIDNEATYSAVFSWRNDDNNHYKTNEGNHGVVQLGPENGLNWDDRVTDIHFEGIPRDISFRAYTSTSIATGVDFRIYESPDGYTWGNHIWKGTELDQTVMNLPLQPTTRYVKLYYTGNYRGYFEDVKITELRQFETDKSSIDFGTIQTSAGIPDEVFVFKHANAGYNVSIELDDRVYSEDGYNQPLEGNFRVQRGDDDISSIPNTGGDTIGQANLKILFSETAEGKYAGFLTIKDQIGDTARIWVSGERINGVPTPTFTWNPNNERYFAGTEIPNFLLSNSSGPIEYTTTDESIAYVDQEGTLHILQPNQTVTIGASQAAVDTEDEKWSSQTGSITIETLKKSDFDLPLALTEAVYNGSYLYSKNGYGWDTNAEQGDGVRLGPAPYGSGIGIFTKGAYQRGDKYIILYFNGTPDSLFMDYRTNSNDASWGYWKVSESEDGEHWTDAWEDEYNSSRALRHAKVGLNHASQYVRIMYSGNYGGHVKNVYITSYEGIHYLRTLRTQNQNRDLFVSRGGVENHQAVADDYGLALRHVKMTKDNDTYVDMFQYADNNKYLCQSGEIVDTYGNEDAMSTLSEQWAVSQTQDKEGYILQNKSSNRFLKVADDGLLALVEESNATLFLFEIPKDHLDWLQELSEKQALDAALEFNVVVEDRARLTEELIQNDYIRTGIEITPAHNPIVSVENINEVYETGVIGGLVDGMQGTINNVTPGLYRLTLKALFRETFNEQAYSYYGQDIRNSVAYVAANGVKTPIMSVYSTDENSDYASEKPYLPDYQPNQDENSFYPNSTYAAGEAFKNEGRYNNEVYFYVEADEGQTTGTIHYGLYCPSNAGRGNWLCYEGYTLTRFERKEYVFDNGGDSHDGNWGTEENWTFKGNRCTKDNFDLPKVVHLVRIEEAVTVNIPNAAAHTIEYGDNTSITIEPTGGLSIGMGGIEGATSDNLIIKSDETGTGYLRVSPEVSQDKMPLATVEMYSKAYYDRKLDENGKATNTNEAKWQYIGSPVMNDVNAKSIEQVFYYDWLYRWDETYGWKNARKEQYSPMIPFNGYSLTQDGNSGGKTYTHKGRLINGDKTFNLTYTANKQKGSHLLANSFAAPIDIRRFISEDFGEAVEPIIYIFNTGSYNEASENNNNHIDWNSSDEKSSGAEGQYTAIPIESASWIEKVTQNAFIPYIAPMQGFMIKRGEEGFDDFKLDYSRLVWNGDYKSSNPNSPMRSPRRLMAEQATDTNGIYLQVFSRREMDELFMIELSQFSHAKDRGWDAEKMNGTAAITLYAVEDSLRMAVDATPEIKGTYLGFHSEADSTYYFRFKYVEMPEQLYLLDQQTGKAVPIVTDTTWAFLAQPDSAYAIRFRIVDESMLPVGWDRVDDQTPTDIAALSSQDTNIWQVGENVYVSCLGQHTYNLYDMRGRLIASEQFVGTLVHNISDLSAGVYIATVENESLKVVKK